MADIITIETRDFGKAEISADAIITFPEGLFGFEGEKSFVMISPKGGENSYPAWLQSTRDKNPCFIVFNPFDICPDYQITLSEQEFALLKATSVNDLSVLVLAVVPEDFTQTTVNMRSPVIINVREHLGLQVVLEQPYSFRSPVFKKKAGAQC